MTPYDMIKAQMGAGVPFAAHAGVTLDELGPKGGAAVIALADETKNHIGSLHAGALFTVGEAASGAAMAGAFAKVIMAVRPVAANAKIDYLRTAKSAVRAEARVEGDVPALRAALEEDGKVRYAVAVSLTDEGGAEVATMSVDWHLKHVG